MKRSDLPEAVRAGIGIAAVIAVVLAAWEVLSAFHHAPPELRPHRLNGPSTAPSGEVFRVGDRVRLGAYQLSVNSVADPVVPASVWDSIGLRPGDRMVRLELTVDNASDSELPLGLSTLSIQPAQGPVLIPLFGGPAGYRALANSLPAHSSDTGSLFFGVPQATALGTLVFNPFFLAALQSSPGVSAGSHIVVQLP